MGSLSTFIFEKASFLKDTFNKFRILGSWFVSWVLCFSVLLSLFLMRHLLLSWSLYVHVFFLWWLLKLSFYHLFWKFNYVMLWCNLLIFLLLTSFELLLNFLESFKHIVLTIFGKFLVIIFSNVFLFSVPSLLFMKVL